MSRLDASHRAFHGHGLIQLQPRGETCPNPQRVDQLDEHPVDAEVAHAPFEHARPPLDFQNQIQRVAARSAAFDLRGGTTGGRGHGAGSFLAMLCGVAWTVKNAAVWESLLTSYPPGEAAVHEW